jgi:hypothetical protein
MNIALLFLGAVLATLCYLVDGIGPADATQSQITDYPLIIEPGIPFTVKLQAKDGIGISLISGGDLFYIDFQDKCTWQDVFI